MTFPWKCFFPLLSKFFTPFAQSTIRNTKISCDVCFAFSTGLKQLDCLLLKFFCVGRLRFVHRTLLFLFYQISLFRPPKSGSRSIPFCRAWPGCRIAPCSGRTFSEGETENQP